MRQSSHERGEGVDYGHVFRPSEPDRQKANFHHKRKRPVKRRLTLGIERSVFPCSQSNPDLMEPRMTE
ncbi:hypothetical protein TNCV_2256021 [Trichonephila clavipes]|nr:hypothetical protein TNCV_2256021 [Trichonephila clavipes]